MGLVACYIGDLPQVGYSRAVAAVGAAAVVAPRYVGAALCAHVHSQSHGARAACEPLAHIRGPPYLLSTSPVLGRARSTAHATRAQILQPVARSSAHFPVRNPNHSMNELMLVSCAYMFHCRCDEIKLILDCGWVKLMFAIRID